MAYNKFKVKDNAYWNLLSGISASATTINLEAWDGDRFPASNFVATMVEYTDTGDDTTPILGQEKILVVNRSWDTLTVTRGYNWSTARSFNAGDNIYVNVTSIIIEDIQDEVTRLESDKLNISAFNSTLRNNLWNWKVIYTNGSGDETELTLWSAGQFLKSNGASSAPTWESPTVDINWLTEDNDTLDTDDMLVYYDWAGNKKRKAKATTSQEWLLKTLTNNETLSWTTFWWVTWDQLNTFYWYTIAAWTTYTLANMPTARSSSSSTYTKLKEFTVWSAYKSWTYTITYSYDNNASATSQIDVRKNWSSIDEKSYTFNAEWSYSFNTTLSAWDVVSFWIRRSDWWWGTYNNFIISASCKYDIVNNPLSTLTSTINID